MEQNHAGDNMKSIEFVNLLSILLREFCEITYFYKVTVDMKNINCVE